MPIYKIWLVAHYFSKTLVWQRQCYVILFYYISPGHRGTSASIWLGAKGQGSDYENVYETECDTSKYGDKIFCENHL